MKTIGKRVMAVVIGLVLVMSIGCATAPKPSGFLGEHYKDLKPGEKGQAKLIWVKPGTDFTKYNKVMVDYVVFAFAEESEYKGIDADELKKIADSASLALVNAIKKQFPVVAEPGPDVIRIRAAIVDMKQSRPVLSGVSSVLPIGLGISIVKKGATGAWTGSGATTAEMMVLDSMTNQVLAAAQDERAAAFTERFTKWGSAEDAFEFWGERFTNRLVTMTKKK
jgi:hypothetical protein